MGKKKKAFEINFGTLLLIIIGICCIIFAFKNFSKEKTKAENNQNENINSTENITEEQTEEKIYSNNVISLNIGKLSDSWKVVEKQNGSIIFYIQGPIKQNEDGTTDDIRINVYLEKSSMTNDELKTQMLEHSVYSNIEYTKIQLIDDVQWRQFDAENKEQKAKILAIMKDGYMYAIEITGEKSLYEQYYNEAMRTVMTVKFAERIPEDLAQKTIYNYDKYVNLKAGGTKYLLSSLNLSKTIEESEEKLSEEYSEYTFTGIKYSDFEDAMTKYMTTDVLKNEFSEFINYNGVLYMKDVTGKQSDYMINQITEKSIKGNETTYEIEKQNMNNFITLKQNITLKYANGTCVVSNVES
jgi:cbb3-type cytochrome oxidase subunit 3